MFSIEIVFLFLICPFIIVVNLNIPITQNWKWNINGNQLILTEI